jgi:hypothetical protein
MVQELGDLWTWPLVAIQHGFRPETFREAMNDVLEVAPWKGSGWTTLIKLPRSLAWALQNLCGAAAVGGGDVKAALAQLQRSFPKGDDDGRTAPLIEQPDLLAWPAWIGQMSVDQGVVAWEMMKSLGTATYVTDVFGPETQFVDALVGYWSLLCVADLATSLREAAQRGPRIAPVHWVGADRDDLSRASRLALSDGGVERVAQACGVDAEVVRNAWPRWFDLLRERLAVASLSRTPFSFDRRPPELPR